MADDDAAQVLGRVLRHDYGRVVAALLREFGGARLPLIEDALGQAMLEAMAAWRARGVPAEPRAFLHRAARHRVIDELRRTKGMRGEEALPEGTADAVDARLCDDVGDDELSALFAAAHPSIVLPSQLVFALRILCGFSTREVATRLVTSEENVQKRFERARAAFETIDVLEALDGAALAARSESVLHMLYVLFTEGYLSSHGERALRLELCREAQRLLGFVLAHPRTTSPRAEALAALMMLHHARRDARVDERGEPVLLENQDRTLYRHGELAAGLDLLMRCAQGGLTSKYHLEAAIVAEHALAPSFAATRWPEIVRLYERLFALDPSPLHALHGAIALSYAEGPDAGLSRLARERPPTWLLGSHLWLATHADMHARKGELDTARTYYEKAIAVAPPVEARMLTRRKHDRCGNP